MPGIWVGILSNAELSKTVIFAKTFIESPGDNVLAPRQPVRLYSKICFPPLIVSVGAGRIQLV